MSTPVTFNGTTYSIPVQGDLNWGPSATRIWLALGTYALAPSGGLFTLTADVNFGASFGLLSSYFSSRGASPATSGLLRLTKTDAIEWKNNGGSGNNILSVNSSDQLLWNGSVVSTGLGTLTDGAIWIGNGSNLPIERTLTGDITTTNTGVTSITAGSIVNNDVNASAAIAYSKLNLLGSIVNTDIASSASITYSKLDLSNSVLNSDINTSAAIDTTKLANGSVSNTEFQYLDGVTSAIQTQLDAKQATGNYITALTGDITASGPGSVASTLATVNSNVGSFTNASLTVNAKGLITAASSGSAGSGTVSSGTAGNLALYPTSTTTVGDTFTNSTFTSKVAINTPLAANVTNVIPFYTTGNANNTFILSNSGASVQNIDGAALQLTNGASPAILKMYNKVTNAGIAAITPSASIANSTTRTYTLPEAGADASFVMTEGAQTINGAKTLGSALAMGSNKITGLSNGTVSTDAAAFGQIPIITSWASYTPTFVGLGTVSNVSFFWKQIGDSLFVQGTVKAGTVAGTPFTITLPSGKTIDYTKCPNGTANTALAGRWYGLQTGGLIANTAFGPAFADGTDTGNIYVALNATAGSGFTKANGSALMGNTSFLCMDFQIPIS